MQSHTAKQEALDVIQRLPDNADIEEIMYRLYVLDVIYQFKAIRSPLYQFFSHHITTHQL